MSQSIDNDDMFLPRSPLSRVRLWEVDPCYFHPMALMGGYSSEENSVLSFGNISTFDDDDEEECKSRYSNCAECFLCPINLTPMKLPYIDSEGNSYEHSAIMRWLSSKSKSPITREGLMPSDLVPNIALRLAIREFSTTTVQSTNNKEDSSPPKRSSKPTKPVSNKDIVVRHDDRCHLTGILTFATNLFNSQPKLVELPTHCFHCPLTGQQMIHPVIDGEGYTYEEDAIKKWLEYHRTSPITGNPSNNQDLASNRALEAAIQVYGENQPERDLGARMKSSQTRDYSIAYSNPR